MNIQIVAIYLFLLTVAILPSTVFAEEQIQIYPLNYRTTQEILPQIKPLLEVGDRVSAADNHLVVIAPAKTLEAVESLIQILDRPRKQFLVQVKWVDGPAVSAGHLGFDGASGQTTLPAAGITFGTSQRQGGQRLQVTEGQIGQVVTGKDVPYTSRWAAWTGAYSQGVAETISFQQIRSGFSIMVRATANGVLRVEVVPQLMSVGSGTRQRPGVVILDRLATWISTRSGKWVDLAAFLPEGATGVSILAGSEEELPAGRKLMLRIDEQN